MRFSYVNLGRPSPKKIMFTALGLTSKHSAKRAAKRADVWLNFHSDDVVIYRMKAITVKACWGLAYRTNSYFFYKETPR